MGKLIISTQITLDGVMTVGEWFNQHGERMIGTGRRDKPALTSFAQRMRLSWDARITRVCQPSGQP